MSGVIEFSDRSEPVRPSNTVGKPDGRTTADERDWLPIWKPSDFINFSPPEDFVLMGDCHLVRGGVTVLGGWPGVGKSRAAMALAFSGATRTSWLGHQIHARFRTLVVQCENGPFRLKSELAGIAADIDEFVRITPPPPYGLAFGEAGFRKALRARIEDFGPGLLVIDPWNRVADGDKQVDYREALDAVLSCLPVAIERRPAVLVVHHMRKKGSEAHRKRGRDLLHELAGSYQIGSAARCVFALEPASADVTDETVVLTCCKNNDGREGEPSAWYRRNGSFDPCEGFDMAAFLAGEEGGKGGVSWDAVAGALRCMRGATKPQAVRLLTQAGVCGRSAAYEALKRFPENIVEDEDGRLWWKE